MNRRKLSHDWMLSADQTDTGKMGVRIKCEGNIYPMHLRHYLTITRQQISEYVKPTPPGEIIMATESVDEIFNVVDSVGRLEAGKITVTPEEKRRIDAYYTRECARKVLEGRLEELKNLPWRGSSTSYYRVDGPHVTKTWLKQRIAELRAAIQELGGAMPEPQQPKPLEEK